MHARDVAAIGERQAGRRCRAAPAARAARRRRGRAAVSAARRAAPRSASGSMREQHARQARRPSASRRAAAAPRRSAARLAAGTCDRSARGRREPSRSAKRARYSRRPGSAGSSSSALGIRLAAEHPVTHQVAHQADEHQVDRVLEAPRAPSSSCCRASARSSRSWCRPPPVKKASAGLAEYRRSMRRLEHRREAAVLGAQRGTAAPSAPSGSRGLTASADSSAAAQIGPALVQLGDELEVASPGCAAWPSSPGRAARPGSRRRAGRCCRPAHAAGSPVRRARTA